MGSNLPTHVIHFYKHFEYIVPICHGCIVWSMFTLVSSYYHQEGLLPSHTCYNKNVLAHESI